MPTKLCINPLSLLLLTGTDSLLQFTWSDPKYEDSVNAFARSLRADLQTTSRYKSLEVYVNYAHSDEPLASRYGARKLERLVGLKKKWDPENFFEFNNALPTT